MKLENLKIELVGINKKKKRKVLSKNQVSTYSNKGKLGSSL